MSAIGKLVIGVDADTGLATAKFVNLGNDAENSGKRIQGAFGKIDTREAKGGIMLLGEEIGIHLPRHVQAFLATLPGIGVAMAAAFPILAVVAIGKALFDFTEKLQKHKEEAEKAAVAMNELTISTGRHAEALTISRLKIEDHIRTLEGKPTQNGLRIALEEARKAADDLADSIQKDVNKEAELLGKLQQGTLSKWLSGPDSSQDMVQGFIEAAKKREDLSQQIALAETADEKKALQEQLRIHDKAWDDRVAYELKHTKDQIANPKKGTATDDNTLETKEFDIIPKEELEAKRTMLQQMAALGKNFRTQETEGEKTAADQRKQAGLDAMLNKVANADKGYADSKKLQDAQTKELLAFYDLEVHQGRITAAQADGLKQQSLDKQYQFEMAHFEKVKSLLAGHPELIKKIQDEEDALTAAHNTQIIEGTKRVYEAEAKGLAELAKANAAFQTKQEAEEAAAVKQAIATAAAKNKAWLQDWAIIQASGDNKVKQLDKEIATLIRLEGQYKLTGQAKIDMDRQIAKLDKERLNEIYKQESESKNLGKVFHGVMGQMAQDGQQWAQKVGQLFKQTVDQMNTNLATMVTTGKADWRSMAQGAIESIIKIELQYLESKILMMAGDQAAHAAKKTIDAEDKIASAKKAFHNTYATVSDWPIVGPILAPELAALAFAGVMAFAGGGLVPGSGNGDIIPALLTPGERVLTVQENQMLSRRGSNGGAQNVHYNPVINGQMDEKQLHAHFERWARAQSRKRGQRWN